MTLTEACLLVIALTGVANLFLALGARREPRAPGLVERTIERVAAAAQPAPEAEPIEIETTNGAKLEVYNDPERGEMIKAKNGDIYTVL